MIKNTLPFTDTFASAAKPGTYSDFKQRGLVLRIGIRKRSWAFTLMHRGQTFTATLGSYPAINTHEARLLAAERVAAIESGRYVKGRDIDPSKLTLKQAWEIAQKRISNPQTLSYYAGYWRRELKTLERDLVVDINAVAYRHSLAELHNTLLRDKGGFVANGALRTLRSIIGHAHDLYPEVGVLQLHRFKWAKEEAYRPDLCEAIIRNHHEAIATERWVPRQCFQQMLYFGGFRPMSLQKLRWSHIQNGWIRGAHGKSGTLDMPLSTQAQEVLERARGYCYDRVFPSPTGRELGQYRMESGICARAVRKYYATTAHKTVMPVLAEQLMHHALPKMIGVYDQTSDDDLTEAAQKVGDALLARRCSLL